MPFCYGIIIVLLLIHFSDTDILLKDTARKFGPGGQTLTPRHTIDAILGIKNRADGSDGKWSKKKIL